MKNQLLRNQVVFPILLFAVCAPQILVGQSPSVIKIGSWNVEWFYDADQSDNRSDLAKEKSAPSKADWQWKLDSVVKVVAKHQPYVMAFQEIENRKVLFDIRNQLRKDHQ